MTRSHALAVSFLAALATGVHGASPQQALPADFAEFSCAVFPANVTEARLIEKFGEANVRRASVFGNDDGPQPGAILFDGSSMKVELAWGTTGLAWARTREPGSPWRTSNGIAIGMDLLGLERRNGWPFRLGGFGTEGQGVIGSWGRGRMQSEDLDGCQVLISLQPYEPVKSAQALQAQVYRGRFSSGHPAMQAINPRVASLTVWHTP